MNKLQYFFIVFSVILISSICYFFSTGFYDVWPLIWLAPIPILLFSLYERRILIIFITAFLAYFIGGMSILDYANTMLPISSFILSACIGALIFAFIIIANHFIILKNKKWWAVFAFPSLLVACEFFVSLIYSAGTADSLAYTQIKLLPIIQIASITGIWGITFILGLFANTVALGWYFRQNKNQFLRTIFIPTSIILIALCFGVIRMNYSKPKATMNVALLAAPLNMHKLFSFDFKNNKEVALAYLKLIPTLKKQGASIILMPEEIIFTKPNYHHKILALFEKTARKNNVMLVFGLREIMKDQTKNTAVIITKHGELIAQYYKHHLVPATEGWFYVGKNIHTFTNNGNLLGIIICKDGDFIHPSLQYGRRGIGAIFVPAWDFGVDRWLHAKPSFMRGVEGGFSVIRAALDGYLSVTDECGRILAIKPVSFKQPVYLLVKVPVYSGNTFYAQFGNWFVWLSILIVLFFFFRVAI